MIWLLTHIWFGLALAALFGLLIGWAIRGIMLKGKARDAIVARNIALTELEQSRLEIDQLYAAQSKGIDAAAQAGDDTLRLELEAREEKLKTLGEELASSRDELEALKSKAVAGASVAAVGAAGVVGAALSGVGKNTAPAESPEPRLDADLNLNDASLEWRNRYLASRVRSLEVTAASASDEPVMIEPVIDTEAVDAATARAEAAEGALEAFRADAEGDKEKAIAAALAASAASAVAGAALAGNDGGDEQAGDPDEDLRMEKQAWQSRYLQQRIAYLENNPPKPRDALVHVSEEDVAENADISGDAVNADLVQDPGELEQELARLRWRNRYLEGRLAYIDGDAPKSDAEIAAQSDVMETEGSGTANGVDTVHEPESLSANADRGPRFVSPTPADNVLAAIGGGQTEVAETDTDETGNAGEPTRPEAMLRPDNAGDDLSRIEGIGIATAAALNKAGIWHFHQIAGWTPENSEWINDYLKLEGRVEAENWVGQAGALSLGADMG